MDGPGTFDVTEATVRELVEQQHPDLATLPLGRATVGCDNAVFRLGDELALRVPRREVGATLLRHERAWLPVLLAGVPGWAEGGLDASAHLRAGEPGCGYPWAWAVVPWHVGSVAASAPVDDPFDAAERMGRFLAALHRPAPVDAPVNPWRGGPLAVRLGTLSEHLDRVAALGRSLGEGVKRRDVEDTFARLAEGAVDRGPAWWLHGDLHLGNLIVREGALRAVIDFGDVCSGDRATDLAVAWTLFPGSAAARAILRSGAGERVPVDDATWERARGWAVALNVSYLQGEVVVADRVAACQRGLAAALRT